MRVIVWSQNPKKIEAVKAWFKQCKHTKDMEIKTISLDTPSLISETPLTMEETMEWALNRAKFCRRLAPDWNYFIWLEWGTTLISDKAFLFWVICIIDKTGRENYSTTTMIQLPAIYKKRLYEDWKWLEDIAEELSKVKNIWEWIWVIWNITWGDRVRSEYFADAVRWAISRFYSVIK